MPWIRQGGFFITCKCGVSIELTISQFEDFDCGMMGFLYCPECNNILAPHFKERNIKIEEMDDKPKVVLTFSAQQYGMTVEMLMEHYPELKKEDILVEEYDGQYFNLH